MLVPKILFLVALACAEETCVNKKTLCTGLGEVRMERDKDWECNPITQHPHLQVPILCAHNNRFIPRIFTLKNESVGNNEYRISLTPNFAYEDDKSSRRLKYEFQIKELSCGPLHAVIDVINHMERNPNQVFWEVCIAIILVLFVISVCICAALEDQRHGRSGRSNDFATGWLLGSSSCETKAHFE